MQIISCAGCNLPIRDKFLLEVLDRTWHTDCVQCHDCGLKLHEKCFTREGRIYCRDDFFKRYGIKCSGCSFGIKPDELVRKFRNKHFHLKCLSCILTSYLIWSYLALPGCLSLSLPLSFSLLLYGNFPGRLTLW